MDAFKEHAIANIKDLRHEMMLEYVHHELVPKLLLKCENKSGCLFDDNNGNDHDAAAVTNNNTVAVSNELATSEGTFCSYGHNLLINLLCFNQTW